MIKDMKVFVNGQEISIPEEIKQIMNLSGLAFNPQERTPVNPFANLINPFANLINRPQKVRCVDEQVRAVVIEMNKKLMELEKLIKFVRKPKVVTNVVKDKVKKPKIKDTKNIKPKIKLSSKANSKGSSIKTSKVSKVTNVKKRK